MGELPDAGLSLAFSRAGIEDNPVGGTTGNVEDANDTITIPGE
jgi:hypothetical protein